ncbi:metal-sensitive transcriptional regulator [Candidatus Uhrbacteria bacterium]|nr:metal-sensitive transcriptional regulator [Candidatus Uhrbacteria bacterium]
MRHTTRKPMSEDVLGKRRLLNRLSYVRGHVEAVRKMVEKGAYCPDVILQNLAIVKALKRVNELILAQHLRSCARDAMRSDDADAQARVEREIVNIVRNSC